MAATIESAWGEHPDYEVNLVPHEGVARAWLGDRLLAESTECLRVQETKHVDRLYFPEASVRWDLFTPTDHHTVCPFKGQADYWTLHAADPPEENVLWAYRTPFDEVAGLAGYVCFYEDRVRVELVAQWDDDPRSVVTTRFPDWGGAADLVRLIDVQPAGEGHWVGPAYGESARGVVEGGQILAEAIVAAARTVPEQRVTSGYMIFSKAAMFDVPIDLHVEVLRRGRTVSAVEVRVLQDEGLRSTGLLLLDRGAPDLFRGVVEMPDVAGPYESEPLDMRVSGRDIRVVDGAYKPDPDLVGPPEIDAWIRFRDAPAEACLHQALLAQATTHWTIAAGMLPHKGFGERDAHVTLSTGPLSVSIAFHDDVDVSEWMLYSNPAIYAGRGLVQGEGHVFTEDGGLVASYTVQAMVRGFDRDPSSQGLDYSNAM
ncbi:MAG TPA: DUF427 domain-containing protein [Acidimicrobiia bacterium]|jgi:uncharacterized protein (DUF427 family)/acyl-CoA thioesterase